MAERVKSPVAPVQAPVKNLTTAEAGIVYRSITVRKGAKLPTEPYGGDKYGSFEVGLEITADIQDNKVLSGIATVSARLDEQLSLLVNEEIKQLKGE